MAVVMGVTLVGGGPGFFAAAGEGDGVEADAPFVWTPKGTARLTFIEPFGWMAVVGPTGAILSMLQPRKHSQLYGFPQLRIDVVASGSYKVAKRGTWILSMEDSERGFVEKAMTGAIFEYSEGRVEGGWSFPRAPRVKVGWVNVRLMYDDG
jgi:hypothetical protein